MESSLGWTIARVPFEVNKVWGGRGRVRVKGEINGFPFRTSLFPTREGVHFLLINRTMQAGSGASAGSTAAFRLEPDTEKRPVITPSELLKILKSERSLTRWYNALGEAMRRDIGRWILDVKSQEARTRRAEQIAERLMATMEAEIDLPPAIRTALARDPRAEEGWKLMSPSRRRFHLMGISGYRAPASQARRIAKAVQDAYQLGEKAAKKRDRLP
jgi:uncharacterized protein YdeI (YjbR/CyaY-like superfamily)